MSMLDVGSRCASCALVDFLPTKCPHCGETFCQSHISSHPCPSDLSESTSSPGRIFDDKAVCDVRKCENPSMEAIAGYTTFTQDIASAIRCPACDGSFCTSHRQQDQHDCPGARAYNARGDAADARKEKAKQMLDKHFPGRKEKGMVKPVAHTRDTKRLRPDSPERLPPSVQAEQVAQTQGVNSTGQGGEAQEVLVKKTKEDKMWDIQLRKIKMSAKPLDPKQKGDVDRRFFELRAGVTSQAQVEEWEKSGKIVGSVDKLWIHQTTPIGKMLDLIIERRKISRPKGDDPAQALSLVAFSAMPNRSRRVVHLELASPASSIPEGSTIVLLQGRP